MGKKHTTPADKYTKKDDKYYGVNIDIADHDKVSAAAVKQATHALNDNPRDNTLDE